MRTYNVESCYTRSYRVDLHKRVAYFGLFSDLFCSLSVLLRRHAPKVNTGTNHVGRRHKRLTNEISHPIRLRRKITSILRQLTGIPHSVLLPIFKHSQTRLRGSSRFRRPSPSRLKLNANTTTNIPGTIDVCGATLIYSRPSDSRLPQLGVGGWTPKPRNPKADSRITAWAIPRAAITINEGSVLGSTCLSMVYLAGAPILREASTNSFSFTTSVSPLTIRIKVGNWTNTITIMMLDNPGPIAAIRAIPKRIDGKAIMMSVLRITMCPQIPPK